MAAEETTARVTHAHGIIIYCNLYQTGPLTTVNQPTLWRTMMESGG